MECEDGKHKIIYPAICCSGKIHYNPICKVYDKKFDIISEDLPDGYCASKCPRKCK